MSGITFGSVGDIIAVGQLACGLVKALSDTRGSAKEFQALIKDLKSFDRALLQIIALWQNYDDSPELADLGTVTKDLLGEWRSILLDFRTKFEKQYGSHLSNGTSGVWIRVQSKKILWLKEKEDILELRRRLCTASEMVTLLTLVAMGKSNKLDARQNSIRVAVVNSMLEQSLRFAEEQVAHLKLIGDKVDSQLVTSNMVLSTVKSGVTYLTQIPGIAIDLRNVLGLLRSHLVAQSSTPRGLERLDNHWKQAPVTLEDALGFLIPIPLELVTSWEMLNVILTQRFEKHPGHQLVKHGRFAIEEGVTGQTINRDSEWSLSFRPGKKVDMSMMFTDPGSSGSSCPRCQTESVGSASTRVQCQKCNMWFQRISNADPDSDETLTFDYIEPDEQTPNESPSKLSRPSVRPEDFQRVRLVTAQGPAQEAPNIRGWWNCSECSREVNPVLLGWRCPDCGHHYDAWCCQLF